MMIRLIYRIQDVDSPRIYINEAWYYDLCRKMFGQLFQILCWLRYKLFTLAVLAMHGY